MNLLEHELVDDLEYEENILEDEENIQEDALEEPVKSFSSMSVNQSAAEIAFSKIESCPHDEERVKTLITTMREVIKAMSDMQKIISTMSGSFKQ